VTVLPTGHEIGTAGRNIDGKVECEVKIVALERREVRREMREVNCVDAVDSKLDGLSGMEGVFRIDQTNASISSKMREWMRRCMLLWRRELKR
jgi:hypothetical protein